MCHDAELSMSLTMLVKCLTKCTLSTQSSLMSNLLFFIIEKKKNVLQEEHIQQIECCLVDSVATIASNLEGLLSFRRYIFPG